MRRAPCAGVLAAALILSTACRPQLPADDQAVLVETTAYINGLWYDGADFTSRTGYVRDGRFVAAPSGEVSTSIDLAGAVVLPAFTEAHHHMVLCEPGRIEQFIDAGILYAGIMNASVSSRTCQAEFHRNDSVEILNTLAGLTATDSHPSQIGLYFLEADEIDGEWVHLVDDENAIDRVWSRIEASPPDILKIFLSYSEDHARLRTDSSIKPWYRGLDPTLVDSIVERAHRMDLRVAAHVMSAHDFEVAIDSGVDLIAHMPGFAPDAAFTDEPNHPYLSILSASPGRYRIAPEVAARAATRGVAVMTTLSGGPPSPSVVHNVETLREAGVALLIGSDRGEFNSVDEAVFLVEQGLMPATEVVRSLTVTTTRALFPGREVGSLEAGAEATFVALRGSPVDDISMLREPLWVVKRGMPLRTPESRAEAN